MSDTAAPAPAATLSEQTIRIVKSTAPILKERGLDITVRFYVLLFDKYPSVKEYFNFANQLDSSDPKVVSSVVRRAGAQPMALANAVYAYAANIDNLGALGPAVHKISQKHASLSVPPEHYPAVGECLIQAVAEVLGPQLVTAEVGQAWTEAYNFLAKILIDAENQIRAEAEKAPGGWSGFRRFKVSRVEEENSYVRSYYLKPEDGGSLPEYKPGQFLSFRLNLSDGKRIYRNYSLSDRSGHDYFRVTIKREPQYVNYEPGLSSNHFHDHVHEGDVIEVGPPLGDFFLKSNPTSARPLVLISAGIGLTPLISMLNTIVDQRSSEPDSGNQEPDLFFVHSTKNSQHHALKAFLKGVATRYPRLRSHVAYTSPLPEDRLGTDYDSSQRISVEQLKKILPSNQAEFYFCGPLSFQKDLEKQLIEWGVPAASIHYEVFGPSV